MESPKIKWIKYHLKRHPDMRPSNKSSDWNNAKYCPEIRAIQEGLPQFVDVLKHA
jgi:hypothetical protein